MGPARFPPRTSPGTWFWTAARPRDRTIHVCFRLAGTEDVVPHAHRAISNLKAWLLGTHRGVGADQLPVYLDEFVFRWNRRRSPMVGFLTLLGLGTHREPTTYEEILGRPAASNGPRSRGRKTGLTRSAEA